MAPETPSFDERDRCPHCGGLTIAAEHEELWWVCGVCGGPRIPVERDAKLSDASIRALKQAHAKRTRGTLLRLTSWATAFGAALGVGLGAILVPASIAGAIVPFALGVILAVLTLAWRRRASALGADARSAWERAWDIELERMIAADKGSLTPAEIARRVKVPEEEVEKIAARLSATDRVRVDVGDDAQLRISTSALPPVEEDAAEDDPAEREMKS